MNRYMTAPWREEYVRTGLRSKICPFCAAGAADDDAKVYVLYRGRYNFVILNRYPYTTGHLMISPYRHLADMRKATAGETTEMMALLQKALEIMSRVYNPHGFNVGMNLGSSAGAGVAGHIHLHVIPRWTGDANFMPIVGRTKVFLEDLGTTYEKMRPLFNERTGPAKAAGKARKPADTNRGAKC